jgi:uncharacterized membrane protein YdjX (TVP38/TMEM64 family)
VVGIAVVVGAVALAGLALSPDRVLERLAALRSWPAAFAAVVTALYLVRPLVAWPLSLCSAVVGYGYELVGLPFALVGVCVTCLPPYVLGRYAGGNNDTESESGLVGRLSGSGECFFERTGGGSRGCRRAARAAASRPGVGRCRPLRGRFREYLRGTLLGEIPWTVAAVLAGRSLDRLATAGLAGASVELAVAAGAIALLVLAGPTYEFVRDRRRPHQNVSEQS